MALARVLACVVLCVPAVVAAAFEGQTPTAADCTAHYFTQPLDQFTFEPAGRSYQQRYFVCGEQHWDRRETSPVFFYCGNEADITLYINHTGLMWENAERYHALLLFAEHRYYGTSVPQGPAGSSQLKYLSHEQAMADYAKLLYSLKQTWGVPDAPVIAFGGSYGGMLAAWMRLKYPGTIHGAVAASAPILAFEGYGWNSNTHYQVVTHDATAEAGSAPACVDNVRATWPVLFDYAEDKVNGWKRLEEIFRLCAPITSSADIDKLALLIVGAWDTMAMGNYPYASSYLTNGAVNLVPFPVRAACQHMADEALGNDPESLLQAMSDAVAVFTNATGTEKCNNLDDTSPASIWEYQWCTEAMPDSGYFTLDGHSDMFYHRFYNHSALIANCKAKYHVDTVSDLIPLSYGSVRDIARYGSNIVFTNGNYDPWSAGGVLQSLSPSMPVFIVDQGAHHMDLMFSHPLDTPSVKEVRRKTLEHVDQWLAAHNEAISISGGRGGIAMLPVRQGQSLLEAMGRW